MEPSADEHTPSISPRLPVTDAHMFRKPGKFVYNENLAEVGLLE